MLKDKFKFKTTGTYGISGIVYTAEKRNKYGYDITWEFDGVSQHSFYGVEVIESMILAGKWEVVKEPQTEKELTQRSIAINLNSAYAAAKWEFENNHLSWKPERSLQEILNKINDSIEQIYEKAIQQETFEYLSCGTGSWMVQFSPEDEDYGTINVVTDVSTGMPIYYVDVQQYLEQA